MFLPAAPPVIDTLPSEGLATVTLTSLEVAEVDPVAFVAVTLQRIGLTYKLKKLEGGEYVEDVAPEMLSHVDPWSLYCHWYA
jgi:hypothetical protein